MITFKCPKCNRTNKVKIDNLKCVCGLEFKIMYSQVRPAIDKIIRHNYHAYVVSHYCMYDCFHRSSYIGSGDYAIAEGIDYIDIYIVPYYVCADCKFCCIDRSTE
ncbi:hypothetical protein D4R86_01485 [bacterium]|nr:MAG: hypothetical protein D4R86_01485 [bacterium]